MPNKIYEGHCSDLPFKRGDKVRVKKGARLFSTHPKKDGEYNAYRSQIVTIHHTMPGQSYGAFMIRERERLWMEAKGFGPQLEEMDRLIEENRYDELNNFQIHTQNPRVVWVGTGSYWVEADINDVEPVADDEEQQ